MCLTIPKKVVEVKDDCVIVESPTGFRQEVKSILELVIGDYVVTQQNIAIEKVGKAEAEEIFTILNDLGKEAS